MPEAMPMGQDDLSLLPDVEIERRLRVSGWDSHHSKALRHEQQRRQLSTINSVLERSEKLASRFEQQMEKLLGISEAQRQLAEKLERQTLTLIRLTYVLVALTAILFIVAIVQTRIMVKEGVSQSHSLTNAPIAGPDRSW
jgi:hypothetical protein